MRVTKESSDPEALDSEGKCKDIKKVKAKDKITISRFGSSEQTIKLESGCCFLKYLRKFKRQYSIWEAELK